MAEEVRIMHNPCSIRRENGAALVISLLLVAVFLIVGSGALTNSRIDTQIASNDTKVKQALLAAEYALALGESTVEQASGERDLANKLAEKLVKYYGLNQQPAWDDCQWDDRDSIDVTKLPVNQPPTPPMFNRDDQPNVMDPHKVPRLMIATKHIENTGSLDAGKPRTSEIWYYSISAHGAWAKWTAIGNGQPDDKPGQASPDTTYNDRYPGTRVVIQSIYAKRY
jgi:hypothetical protein